MLKFSTTPLNLLCKRAMDIKRSISRLFFILIVCTVQPAFNNLSLQLYFFMLKSVLHMAIITKIITNLISEFSNLKRFLKPINMTIFCLNIDPETPYAIVFNVLNTKILNIVSFSYNHVLR